MGVEKKIASQGGVINYGEYRTLLAYVFLLNFITDRWELRPSVGDGYTVHGVYQMLTQQEMHSHDPISADI